MKKKIKKIKFQEEKTNSKKPKIAARFVAAVLVAALSINGYYAYNMFGGDIAEASSYKGMNNEQIELLQEREAKKKAEEEAGFVSYTPTSLSDDIDTVIVDKGDAEKLFGELRYEMNLFDISDTFPFAYSRSNEYFDVYTMQQYHDGIEVYGREIKMTTDKAGNLLSVNGNPAKLNNFDTTVTLSEDDAYEYLEKYIKSEYQLTTDDVSIDYLGRKIGFDENDEPAMGYMFEVGPSYLNFPCKTLLIDANFGNVISTTNLFGFDMVTRTFGGDIKGSESVELDLYEKDNDPGWYYLMDTNRNITLYYGDSKLDLDNPEQRAQFTDVVLMETPRADAIYALANMESIYDFYYNTFSRLGNDNMGSEYSMYLKIGIKDGGSVSDFWTKVYELNVFGTNAMGGINRMGFVGSDGTRELDVMGHEFAHGVIHNDSGITGAGDDYKQSGAIDEGLADLFGEFAEDYHDDKLLNGTCNWIYGKDTRYISEPSKDESAVVDAIAYGNGKERHNASYITSYSAYLMTQGINGTEALTNEDLARLYYNSLNQLNSGCTFMEFRKKIEDTALAMNKNTNFIGPLTMIKSDEVKKDGKLTDSQWESVVDSFDRVGIERSYDHSLVNNAVIQVIDVNNRPYDNYHLEINKLNDGTIVVDEDIKTNSYRLPALDKGFYEFVLTDLADPNLIKTVSVIINDNVQGQLTEDYKESDNILTNFGTLNKEVAIVLDNSVSMEGEPLAQTKQSALNFVETVFEANPNINVTLITFADSATLRLKSCNNKAQLCGTIMGLGIESGTKMIDALSTAENILNENEVDDKYIIFMSDGVSADSPILIANSIKENDIILCSLGFYHSSSEGAGLMSELASPGYYYNVQNTASIQGVFDEIARQVSGEEYVINEIKCPVEVVVSYNGETLCSAEENQNLRTSFGSITFEGEENEKKVLRLNNKADYEICIYGTGKGTMNYTVSYVDKDGNYTDVRKFEKVPIRKNTVISTQNSKSKKTLLKVDTDGDGKFDLQYSGNSRKTQKLKTDNSWKMLIIIPAVTLAIWLIIEIVLLIIRIKRNRVCANCGLKITKRKIRYCSKCGGPVNTYELFPKWTKPVGRKKAAFILKIVCVASCLLITAGTTIIYHSAANTVYLQIRNSDLVSAGIMYEKNIEDTNIPRSYLSTVTDIYLKKVEKAQSKGKISKGEAEDIYNAVAEMDMGKASDSANVKLESLSMTE